MTTEFQVSLDEGKYTYERDDDGQQRALRYGEPWRDLVGDKFVAAMGYEIERLQELLIDDSRLRDDLIKAEKEIERLRTEVEVQAYWGLRWEKAHAELAASQAREEKLLDFIQNAPVSSGVCCCGECMDRHSNPMSCGHSPRDQWDWSVQCLVEESKKHDNSALNERLAQERERVAKYIEHHVTDCGTEFAASIRAMGDE